MIRKRFLSLASPNPGLDPGIGFALAGVGWIILAGLAFLGTAHAEPSATPPHDTIPSLPSAAAPKPPPVFAGQTSMIGYTLGQFGNFVRYWHFVTVRFRRDTAEMRLTYANDKAWDALLAGGTKYPDGAVFAKIGIMTEEDPGFTSSVVPSSARRYQLMVMDHKKHAATDGWGYALFDMNGKTFEQNPVEQVQACHACHKLVPDRDYVFSQPMRLEIGLAAALRAEESGMPNDRIAFVTKSVDALPAKVKEAIPSGFGKARVITVITHHAPCLAHQIKGPAEAGPVQANNRHTHLHHGFLEVLRGSESNLLAGLDLDGFARSRVTPHPRGALAHLQDAKTVDADPRPLLQNLPKAPHHFRQHGVDLNLRQLVGFG